MRVELQDSFLTQQTLPRAAAVTNLPTFPHWRNSLGLKLKSSPGVFLSPSLPAQERTLPHERDKPNIIIPYQCTPTTCQVLHGNLLNLHSNPVR